MYNEYDLAQQNMYCKINSIADSELLEMNLDLLFAWCNTNHLPLNITKCQVIL